MVALEIGTGSGYQAAILCKLVKHVHSIEIVKPLYEKAKSRLEQMGLKNVSVYSGFLKAAANFLGIFPTLTKKLTCIDLGDQIEIFARKSRLRFILRKSSTR